MAAAADARGLKRHFTGMPFHGETTCSRPGCVRRAYYGVAHDGGGGGGGTIISIFCGAHSRSIKDRFDLPRAATSEKNAEHMRDGVRRAIPGQGAVACGPRM